MIGGILVILIGIVACSCVYSLMRARENLRHAIAERERLDRLMTLQRELDAAHEDFTPTETAR